MSDRRGAGRGTVTKAEYESMAAFRYALRRFLRFSEDGAKAVGLTPQQHQALLAIKGYPARDSVTVGELAERLQVRHHSAVGLVDRLEALGLVERTSGKGDRRRVMLELTVSGSKLLERLSVMHRAELRRLGPELSSTLERIAPPSVTGES